MTPEGRIKEVVKAFLKARKVRTLAHPIAGAVGFYRMHVPSGYGEPALDFEGGYKGRFWAVETKANGNTPSAIQKLIGAMHADALCFSIWGDDAEDICKRLGEFFDYVDTLA